MVLSILRALRPNGSHLVATVTSPGLIPACVRPRANARSDVPPPYISEVSNHVIPPSSAVLMIVSMFSCGTVGDNAEIQPLPANWAVPRPIGET
jgi:hypothetical protein